METELRCPLCRNLFKNPVLLPCHDSFCLSCAATLLKDIADPSVPLPQLARLSLQHSTGHQQPPQPPQSPRRHSADLPSVETGSLASGSSNDSAYEDRLLYPPEIPPEILLPVDADDEVSLVSETDSGVSGVSGGGGVNSRPSSYVGSSSSSNGSSSCPSTPGGAAVGQQQQPQLRLQDPAPSSNYLVAHPLNGGVSCSLECPACGRTTLLDENGVHSLPKNRALARILERVVEGKRKSVAGGGGSDVALGSPPAPPPQPRRLAPLCELCPDPSCAVPASVYCEQCAVLYCGPCRRGCHPARGPLARHSLIDAAVYAEAVASAAVEEDAEAGSDNAAAATSLTRGSSSSKQSRCADHRDERVSMYCALCKTPACYACLQEGRHYGHEVHALGTRCKQAKTELSHVLQTLSEKARSGTENLQRLKADCAKVDEAAVEFEASIVAQCEALVAAVQRRKTELLREIEAQKREKSQMLKEQVAQNSTHLQQITALLQYSIEVLKEPDPSAFLLVSSGLIQRVAATDRKFNRHLESVPKITADFELAFDKRAAAEAIENIKLVHLSVPGAPLILTEECSAENNSVTISWEARLGPNAAQFYVLELDDGTGNGNFRQVYRGPETVCSVDGLHFNSIYSTRVKACNDAGDGGYSKIVRLQTAEVAWFRFDPSTAHPDVTFSPDASTVSSASFDDRVALGEVGFSRGVHYWECRVDRYDNHPDPAFGVARLDVAKDVMLGKDDKGWSMYIDSTRSWFMHASTHANRTEGGVRVGTIVGVLLNLNERFVSFFIDDVQQGPPRAFDDLDGVFYPAVSLNRNVAVTLTSGLDPPRVQEKSRRS